MLLAFNFIKANYNKEDGKDVEGGKVIIYGYSYGGIMATHLSERLKAEGITVDLLFTVDKADGNKSDKIDRTVPSNVNENINIYQTVPSKVVGSHGAPNTAVDSKKTKVVNVNVTNILNKGKGNHSKIDNITTSIAVKNIGKKVDKKALKEN